MLEDKDLRSIQEVRTKIELAHKAFLEYKNYTQEQVDAVVDHVAAVARANAEPLARRAVEETGYGNVRDKVAKNLLNSDLLHKAIRSLKTVGIIREDPEKGLIEIAEPVGIVGAILPTTNPTSTAFYKILISLKGRNGIVLSPHPRAVRCTCETASLLARAAVEAGAPEGIVQCLNDASLPGTNELMTHKLTGVILSTGGAGIVRAAYSSGKPALGVGPGNVAVLIESSADVEKAIASIVDGKSFDYGTVCSSEQTVVAETVNRDKVLAALKANGAFLCNDEQREALLKLMIKPNFAINPDCVGQAPGKIAQMAGFTVPEGTRILAVELDGVGREHPMSAEKLSPVLAAYFVRDFAESLDACETILNFGGRGHTTVIYSHNDERIREFGLRMPAFRVLVNTPAPQGSTGITTNLFPAMTLGCGAIAGNVTSDNVGPMHLINIKRIAYHVRDPETAFESEEAKAYFAGKPIPQSVPVPLPASPATTSATQSTSAGKSDISDAVGRYLEQRGIAVASAPVAAPAAASAPAASFASSASPAPAPAVASVVDRFLSRRRSAAGQSQALSTPSASAEEASPPPPAPQVTVVPFVSEDDVRRAILQDEKIYIDNKTIVTPAAADLGEAHDVLVRTE